MVRVATALVCALTMSIGVAQAAQWSVAPGGLGAALAHAHPGDVLVLAPGAYQGPFTVGVRDVTIRGGRDAIIDGGGDGSALTLAADGIAIEGITIRGAGANLADNDSVVLIRESHHAIVRHCRIEARAFGIYVRGGSDNLIAGNEVRGDAALARSKRGNGIHLWHTERDRVLDNTLADVRDGLYFSFAHRNTVRGNRATGVRYGIHYMYSDGNIVTGNRLERCLGGMTLMFSKRNLFADNLALDNARFGILLLSIDDSRFAGNTSAHNDRGLVLENCNANRFERNRIAENAIGTLITAGSDGNVFTANSFDGNLVQAHIAHGGANLWAERGRGNFWSDYAGVDLDGDGVGEIPYRLEHGTSALVAMHPEARWFAMSPALALMDWFQARVLDAVPQAIDPSPLAAPAR